MISIVVVVVVVAVVVVVIVVVVAVVVVMLLSPGKMIDICISSCSGNGSYFRRVKALCSGRFKSTQIVCIERRLETHREGRNNGRLETPNGVVTGASTISDANDAKFSPETF